MMHHDARKAFGLKVVLLTLLSPLLLNTTLLSTTLLSTTLLSTTLFNTIFSTVLPNNALLSIMPPQYASAQTNPTNQPDAQQQDEQQGDFRRAAHNERVSIDLSDVVNGIPVDADTLTVTLDGEPYSTYELQDNHIIFTLPADTNLTHSHITIESDDANDALEQTFEFVASFGSSNLITLVEDSTEQQFRRLVEASGLTLVSFSTVLGSDLSLAEIQLNAYSSAQAIEQMHVLQQVTSQNGAAAAPWVSSPQMLYKPLRRIHSLDPSCVLWSQLQDVTRQWQPLFFEAASGQADVLEALSVPRAHARGDSGRGVTVFVLDSMTREGDDLFTCDSAGIQGHGRYIQDIIRAVAPEATIVPTAVCNDAGECFTRDIAKALLSLQTVLAVGNPVIVTMALGSPPHPELGVDAVIYNSLERLSARYDNLLVVASAGNNGLDGNYQSITARFPAGFWQGNLEDAQGIPLAPLDNVMSIGGIGLQAGSTTVDYRATPFNPQVPISMLAPAARLCLPHPSGGCAPDGSEQGLTGSSFAAPFVAGAAALFWEACPDLPASELRTWLQQDSNFDILFEGQTPNIPVVNAYRTSDCPVDEASLPNHLSAAAVQLEPLSLAINQRYVLEPRLPAGNNTNNNANYLQRQLANHLSDQFNPLLSHRTMWRSSDPSIASIDAHRVHAHAAGEVTLSLYVSDDTYADTSQDTYHLAQANAVNTSINNVTDNKSGILLAQVTLTVLPYACTDPPVIGDAALAARMAERWGSPLTCDVMAQAERLYAQLLGITTLTGFEYAPNLRWLNLGENPLHEGGEGVLEPLSHLHHLETLYLFGSNLDERHLPPLNSLATLELLSLHNNAISNLDLWDDAAFTNLVELQLYNNNITDITSLARMTQVRILGLEGNRIHDVSPLQGLTNLVTLNLAGNAIANIDPLAGLRNLDTLILFDNAIDDIRSLANLSALRHLDLKTNAISNINPLAGLANLSLLELAQNPIDAIEPLRHLTLDLLDISGSAVSELSPVTPMSLATLRAAYTNIRDITPLSGMQNLTELNVAGNAGLGTPETLEVLATLVNLRHLDVSLTGLPADGLAPLTDLAALQTLIASSNQLSNLEPLRNLPRLTHLDLRSNHITDLRPLTENSALSNESSIHLTGNDLLFTPQEALADIDALQARGIHLDIEDLQNGLPATHLVRFVQGEQVMNSHAPDNRNKSNVVLEPTPLANTLISTNAISQWFEMFAPGSYRTRHYANQGWMLRLRGTTLCVSANHPFNGMNVTLWRCLPDDPWQQWQLQHVSAAPSSDQAFPTEPSVASNNPDARRASAQGHWQLVMPNPQGEAYCVSAESNSVDSTNTTNNTNGTDSINVIMWRCDEVGDVSQWRVEYAPAEVLSDTESP